MNHELYIFGSVARGEVSPTSDIDILAIPFTNDRSLFPTEWSIYSPELIEEYFCKGRLFAWHLHLEARCIFTQQKTSFLATLGVPAPYSTMNQDILELESLLIDAIKEIKSGTNSLVYELGIVHTAMRDIAMSASWSLLKAPCFSRHAPYMLPVPCPLPLLVYEDAMFARHSSTRGLEINIDLEKAAQEVVHAPWTEWINSLRKAL